jgi:RHS repeat-associated protein
MRKHPAKRSSEHSRSNTVRRLLHVVLILGMTFGPIERVATAQIDPTQAPVDAQQELPEQAAPLEQNGQPGQQDAPNPDYPVEPDAGEPSGWPGLPPQDSGDNANPAPGRDADRNALDQTSPPVSESFKTIDQELAERLAREAEAAKNLRTPGSDPAAERRVTPLAAGETHAGDGRGYSTQLFTPGDNAAGLVVGRLGFANSPRDDGGIAASNNTQMLAFVYLNEYTSTSAITTVVKLPVGINFVSSSVPGQIYDAPSRELRWLNLDPGGLSRVAQLTLGFAAAGAPALLQITTTVSSPNLPQPIVRLTPVWIGTDAQFTALSAGSTIQATPRVTLTFPSGAVSANTVMSSTAHAGLSFDNGTGGQLLLPLRFEPSINFQKPVQVQIKLDDLVTAGMLSRGDEIVLHYLAEITYAQTISPEFTLYRRPYESIEVPSSYDPATGLLTAEVMHFSNYQVSIRAPSDPGVWKRKVNRGNVGLFRGEFGFGQQLYVPPMSDDLQPDLSVAYSSSAADQGAGQDTGTENGVGDAYGRGWSMDLPRVNARLIRGTAVTTFGAPGYCAEYTQAVYGSFYQRAVLSDYGTPCITTVSYLKQWLVTLTMGGKTYNLQPVDEVDRETTADASGMTLGQWMTEDQEPLYIVYCSGIVSNVCDSSGSTLNIFGAMLSQPFWQVITPDGHRYVFGVDAASFVDNGDDRMWGLRRIYASRRDDRTSATLWSAEYSYTKTNASGVGAYACDATCGFGAGGKFTLKPNVITYGNSVKTDGAAATQRYNVTFAYSTTKPSRVETIQVNDGVTPLRRYVFDRTALGANLRRIREQHRNGASTWTELPSQWLTYGKVDQATLMTLITDTYGMTQTIAYSKTDFASAHIVASLTTSSSVGGFATRSTYAYAQPCQDKRGSPCFNPVSNYVAFNDGFENYIESSGSETLVGFGIVTETTQSLAGTVLRRDQRRFHTGYKLLGREFESKTISPAGEVLASQHKEYEIRNGPIVEFLPFKTWHTSLVTQTSYPGDIGVQPFNRTVTRSYVDLLPQPGYVRMQTGQFAAGTKTTTGIRELPATWLDGYGGIYLIATPVAGTQPVYLCFQSGLGHLSAQACGGGSVVGYAYTSPQPLTYLLSRNENQAGVPANGYVYTSGPGVNFVENIGYVPTDQALHSGFSAVFGEPRQVLTYDTNTLRTENIIAYSDAGASGNWYLKPISETLRDGNGVVLNRTNVYYDGLDFQGTFGSAAGNPVINSLRPIGASLNRALTTRVDISGPGYTLTERYEYDVIGNARAVTDVRGITTLGSYDITGNWLVSMTNGLSQTALFEYYGVAGQALQGTNLASTFGLLKRKINPNGAAAATSYEYDAFGRLAKVIAPGDSSANATTVYNYSDASGAVTAPLRIETQRREAAGCATCLHKSFEFYDGLGQVIQTRSEVDESGGNVRVSSTFYDALGRVITQSTPYAAAGAATFGSYVAPPWTSLVTSTNTFDALGRTLIARAPDGTAMTSSYITTSVTMTDANGNRRAQFSDGTGRLSRVAEFSGTTQYQTDYAYDVKDNLTQVLDALGNRTVITYDVVNRKIAMTDPDMGTWRYAYDRSGNLAWQTDARGRELRLEYDRLSRVIDKQSYAAQFTDAFNAAVPALTLSGGAAVSGGVLNIPASANATDTRTVVASQGRRFRFNTSSTDATLTLSTGQVGAFWELRVNNGLLKITYGIWPNFVTLDLGAAQANTWYEAYMLVNAPVDGASERGYKLSVWRSDNPNDRVDFSTNLTPAVTPSTPWTFKALSNSGVLLLDDHSGITVSDRERYQYDVVRPGRFNIGQRSVTINDAVTTTMDYDARGRVLSETNSIAGMPTKWLASYGYDSLNRVVTSTLPNGEGMRMAYNTATEPFTLTSLLKGSIISSTLYNELGGVTRLDYGNNLRQRYTYWGLSGVGIGRRNFSRMRQSCLLTGATASCAETLTAAAMNMTYDYDNVGNVKTITDTTLSNQISTFAYDPLNRLIGASTNVSTTAAPGYSDSYAFNAIGNFLWKDSTARNYQYLDSAHVHAPTHIGGRQIGWYDANGNMTQRVEITGTVAVTYTQAWDIYNRLTTVTNTVTGQATSYRYNADGSRIRRIAPDGSTYYVGDVFEIFVSTTGPGALSTYAVGEGNDAAAATLLPPAADAARPVTVYLPVAMQSAADQALGRTSYTSSALFATCSVITGGNPDCRLTSYYFHGSRRVGLHEETPAADEVYYLHADHLGSASVVSKAGQVIESNLRYKPWGEQRLLTGLPRTQRRYTGQVDQNDAFVGSIIDYGGRFYAPWTGTFQSPDTRLGKPDAPQNFNRFAYVGNNPLLYTDPDGHCWPICTAIAGAIVGAFVGAAMAAGPQMIANVISGQPLMTNIDATEVAKAAVTGAVTGAIGGVMPAGSGIIGVMAVGAVSGVVEGQAEKFVTNVFAGREATAGLFNPSEMIWDGAIGALSAAGGRVIGKFHEAIDARKLTNATIEKAKSLISLGGDHGPVLSGVMDRRSRRIFFGTNQERPPKNIVSLLSDRFGGVPAYKYTKGAGTHSEIYALNDAILARGGTVSATDLRGFMVNNRWLRKGNKKYTQLGTIDRCKHCAHITSGVTPVGHK